MRILVVATQIRLPGTHGGSTHVGELVEGLRRHGPTRVLARRGSTAPGSVGISLDVGEPPVIRHLLPWTYFPAALLAARRFRPEVIYERGSSYGLGALLRLALGIPLLTMVLDEHFSPLSLHLAGRLVATNTDLVPARFRDKAVRVSWGANTNRFLPDLDGGPARERFRILPDEVVVAYVGSFKGWHDLELLVEAAAALRERPVKYLLLGDGPKRSRIRELADSQGLGSRFILPGRVAYEEVPALLAAADLCVATFNPELHPGSRRATFALDPLKLFEYLAMGKPTIAARTPNVERLFRHDEHLFFITPGDANGLADAIDRYCTSPEQAREMAGRGRRKVLAEHTWQAHADHLVRLFGELLEEPS